MNKFAKLLSDAVKEHQITYRKVAHKAGVSPDLISRIVLGNRLPSPKSALKIAKALNIDSEEALMALNYDKVPGGAKKYFAPSKPKYKILRKALLDRFDGSKSVSKQIAEELEQFEFGSLERLLLGRILNGMKEYQQQSQHWGYKNKLKIIGDILDSESFTIKDEKALIELLSPLSRWSASPPDFSLKMTFLSIDAGKFNITSGSTSYEKPLISILHSEPVEVPLFEDKIAAGNPLPISGNWNETRFFTSSYLQKFVEPILIEVGKDQDSMIPVIFPGDLLLIDRRPVERPKPGRIYAVNLEEGGSVKYCHIEKNNLVITCENKYSDFEIVSLNLQNYSIHEVIIGEVVWVGRELAKVKNLKR